MAAETTNANPSPLALGLREVMKLPLFDKDSLQVLETAALICERYVLHSHPSPLVQRLVNRARMAQSPDLRELLCHAGMEIERLTALTGPQFETFPDRGHRVNPDEKLAQQSGVADATPTNEQIRRSIQTFREAEKAMRGCGQAGNARNYARAAELLGDKLADRLRAARPRPDYVPTPPKPEASVSATLRAWAKVDQMLGNDEDASRLDKAADEIDRIRSTFHLGLQTGPAQQDEPHVLTFIRKTIAEAVAAEDTPQGFGFSFSVNGWAMMLDEFDALSKPPAFTGSITDAERVIRAELALADKDGPEMNRRLAIAFDQDEVRHFLELIDRDREALRVALHDLDEKAADEGGKVSDQEPASIERGTKSVIECMREIAKGHAPFESIMFYATVAEVKEFVAKVDSDAAESRRLWADNAELNAKALRFMEETANLRDHLNKATRVGYGVAQAGSPEPFDTIAKASTESIVAEPTPEPAGLPAVKDIPAWLFEHATVVSCPITKWVCRMAACELETLREGVQPSPGPAIGDNPGIQAGTGHYPPDSKPLPPQTGHGSYRDDARFMVAPTEGMTYEPPHISDGDGHAGRQRFEQSAARATQCAKVDCRSEGHCTSSRLDTCAARRFEGDGRI